MTDTVPSMSKYHERYVAFHGLVQWTRSVIWQCQRILDAEKQFRDLFDSPDFDHHANGDAVRCDHHYFVIAAHKLIEYRHWVQALDLCTDIDFGEIDSFPRQDITDVRNMREHDVAYFQGNGHAQSRWVVETPEYQADASCCAGTLLGVALHLTVVTSTTAQSDISGHAGDAHAASVVPNERAVHETTAVHAQSSNGR